MLFNPTLRVAKPLCGIYKVEMTENSINILEIIEKAINENELRNIGINGEKVFSEFTKEDFTPIYNYVNLYGNKINVLKFISYCICDFWSDFHKCQFKGYLWEKDFVKYNYLEVIIHKLYEIIISYDELFQKDRFDEALSLFRNFVELSSTLFASSIDKNFFDKYTSESESNEEYIKLWFKHLRPKRIVEKLNALKGTTNSSLMDYSIERFAGFQREKLYSYTSSISHGKFSHIIDSSKSERNEIFIMTIDYLINSTMVIHLVNYKYINYVSDKSERKLQIIMQIWIEVLYKHLLK